MADFRSCIVDHAAKGEIDAETAQLAQDAYDDAFASASETLGPVDADRAAADAVMARLEAEAIEARRRRQLSVRTRRAALETIAGLKGRRGYQGVKALGGGDGSGRPPKDGWVQGGKPPEEGPGSRGAMAAMALKRIVENRPGLGGAPGPSVEGRYRAVRGSFDASMADLIEQFETRTGLDQPGKGGAKRATLDNIVREAFGQDTGDAAAKALAGAWSETAERARHMFNAAGGSIGKMDGWDLPQAHDGARVREAGRDAMACNDPRTARKVADDLAALVSRRPETAAGRRALNEMRHDVIDGADLVRLAEAELLGPLDARAQTLILDAAKRVSLVTAVSPRALVDIAYVLYEAAKLIRRLAELYGARPGTLGMFRLARDVLAHLAVTGAVAAGDEFVHQIVGQGLAARLSAKLGEGVVNGMMTARIGVATMETVRPLPFVAVKRPGMGDFLSALAAFTRGKVREGRD